MLQNIDFAQLTKINTINDIYNKFEPFRKRGLHFLHINVNSLLSKIDELRDIVETPNLLY